MDLRVHFTSKSVTSLHMTCDFKDHFNVCPDGLGAEGAEWLAEEGQGRLEQVDSGTESADDRYENVTTWITQTYRDAVVFVTQTRFNYFFLCL